MVITDFIDQRNRDIWEATKSQYSITLCEVDSDYWSAYTIQKTATIYVPRNSRCIDSFTHELLHVYLKAKGVLAGNRVVLLAQGKPALYDYFPTRLWEHLGNCMDHIKMLPIYLERGFAPEKFIEDYSVPKCTEEEIIQYNYFKTQPIHRKNVVEFTVGKFFAINACPNKSFVYSRYLDTFKSNDPTLYSILTNFWIEWCTFEIEKMDGILYDYGEICDKFVDDLDNWISNNA